MIARLHVPHHASKFLEIDALAGAEWGPLEEWNDVRRQMLPVAHAKGHALSVIPTHHTAPEELLHRVQELHIALVLHDGEFGEYLYSQRHLWMRADPDM